MPPFKNFRYSQKGYYKYSNLFVVLEARENLFSGTPVTVFL